MAFFMTLLYIASTLISPSALPTGMANLHIGIILGAITILAVIPSIPASEILLHVETYLVFGLVFAGFVSILATGWMGGAVATLDELLPVVLIVIFVTATCRSLLQIKILVYVMLLVAFFILIKGMTADQSVVSDYVLIEKLYDHSVVIGHLPRLRGMGVLNDPNDLAQFYVFLIPLLWLRWNKDKLVGNLLFTILPAVILCFGIYTTHSRGGTVALIAVVLFAFKDKIGLIGAAIVGAVASAGLLVLNISGGRGMNDDDGDRLGFWSNGLTALKSHPIFGVGLGNYPDINNGRVAHNSFVSAMVELGLFGYIFWMALLVASWTGLTNVVGSRKEASTSGEGEQDVDNGVTRQQWQEPALQMLAPAGAGGISVSSGPQVVRVLPRFQQRRAKSGVTNSTLIGTPEEDASLDEVALAAKVVRIAFVGMMTAGFFLSRTFAVVLYVMFGIAFSVIRLYPRQVSLAPAALFKRSSIAVAGSIFLIYLFVRFHGGTKL